MEMRAVRVEERKRTKTAGYRTRELVYVALFTAVIAVCAWITVPAAIPFTMQVFGVFVTLGLLGGKRGFFAVACYIALGAFGVPIFSGFRGGFGVLSGVTGGYIVGFLFSALVYILITKLGKDRFLFKIVGMVVGLAVCYVFGTAWFLFVKGSGGAAVSVSAALLTCVVPFLPFDCAKIALAALATRVLSKYIRL